MERNKGNISIHTENIFPIIKKWLYSDTMPDYKGKIISGRVITARKVDKSTGNKTWEWGWYCLLYTSRCV